MRKVYLTVPFSQGDGIFLREDKMEEGKFAEFKKDCTLYLSTLGLNTLRSYGRFLCLQAPTKRKKGALVESIVGVLCGEVATQRSKKGAPIKNDYVEPEVFEEITRLQNLYFGEGRYEMKVGEAQAEREESVVLQFTVQPAKLNEMQKQRLNAFLNSL